MAVAGQQFRAIKQRPAHWVRPLFVRAARVPPLAIAKLLFHHEAFFRGEKKTLFHGGPSLRYAIFAGQQRPAGGGDHEQGGMLEDADDE